MIYDLNELMMLKSPPRPQALTLAGTIHTVIEKNKGFVSLFLCGKDPRRLQRSLRAPLSSLAEAH
jgi:hypothetical protein